MENDPAFSPSWKVTSHTDVISTLFYVATEDIFLLITTDPEGQAFEANVVDRPNNDNAENRYLDLVQKLMNYLLHFMWSDIASY